MGIPKNYLLGMTVVALLSLQFSYLKSDGSQLLPKMAVTHQHILNF